MKTTSRHASIQLTLIGSLVIGVGAGMPFDAALLLQCFPTYVARGNGAKAYTAADCTMFAAVGRKAGAEESVVGCNFDWTGDEAIGVCDVRPAEGRRYVAIGFLWHLGVFTGMNDAGLVVCAQRVEPLGVPPSDVVPLELVLKELLETAGTVNEALERLTGLTRHRGYHVLVTDPATPETCVVEFGPALNVRRTQDGLMLGADPASEWVDEAGRDRYTRLRELLADERIVGELDVERVLQDRAVGAGESVRILNDQTRYVVVFRPNALELRVAAPAADHSLGAFAVVSLTSEATP